MIKYNKYTNPTGYWYEQEIGLQDDYRFRILFCLAIASDQFEVQTALLNSI